MSRYEPIQIPDYLPMEIPVFSIGQMVKHRRYGYRGVVVDYDLTCRANEQWYRSNQTQPERSQPWYHILVSDSEINTYAAESSLVADDLAEPIDHPLIDHFFEDYEGMRYVRNDEPWPGWA